MKKSIFIALLLTLFAGSAMALTNGEVKKCTGQLHACFKDNYNLLVDLNPTSSFDCDLACSNDQMAKLGGGCDQVQCMSRCKVAFDLTSLMCH